MSSRRDRERREERQNENQSGGWVGASTTWEGNTATANPIGGSTKTTTSQTGTTTGRNDTYAGSFTEVRDNPGQTNYREPVGAGWDRGAEASSLSSMGDHKLGGPNHVVVGKQTDTNTGTGKDTGPGTGTGTGTVTPVRDKRAENRAHLAKVTNRKTGSHSVVYGARTAESLGHTADQSPQGRRVTSPNTGTLPTLSQNTVTTVQPKKAATETKQDRPVCKARPKDNRPKGGGGGGSKKFVPWC